jgi:hypothetical protein
MPWELKNSATVLARSKARHVGIRLLGLGGALTVLALAGLLMAVPFIVRRDIPLGAVVQLGDLRAVSEVVTESDGKYLLTLQFADTRGSAIDPMLLQVRLAMDGHPMAPTPVLLERTATGAYRAQGQLAMNGRWRFAVTSERGTMDVVADYVRSF